MDTKCQKEPRNSGGEVARSEDVQGFSKKSADVIFITSALLALKNFRLLFRRNNTRCPLLPIVCKFRPGDSSELKTWAQQSSVRNKRNILHVRNEHHRRNWRNRSNWHHMRNMLLFRTREIRPNYEIITKLIEFAMMPKFLRRSI